MLGPGEGIQDQQFPDENRISLSPSFSSLQVAQDPLSRSAHGQNVDTGSNFDYLPSFLDYALAHPTPHFPATDSGDLRPMAPRKHGLLYRFHNVGSGHSAPTNSPNSSRQSTPSTASVHEKSGKSVDFDERPSSRSDGTQSRTASLHSAIPLPSQVQGRWPMHLPFKRQLPAIQPDTGPVFQVGFLSVAHQSTSNTLPKQNVTNLLLTRAASESSNSLWGLRGLVSQMSRENALQNLINCGRYRAELMKVSTYL